MGTHPNLGGAKASPSPIRTGDRFRNKLTDAEAKIININGGMVILQYVSAEQFKEDWQNIPYVRNRRVAGYLHEVESEFELHWEYITNEPAAITVQFLQFSSEVQNKAVAQLKEHTGFIVGRNDFGWMAETRVGEHKVQLVMQQLRHKGSSGIQPYDEVLFTLEKPNGDLVAKLGCWCVYERTPNQWFNLDEG